MVKNHKQVTLSDWIQFLEYKTKSLETYSIVCLTIFFSFMAISLALWTMNYSYNTILIFIFTGIIFVVFFFIFFIFASKPVSLLNKIMNSNDISVEEIRTEWYSKKSTISSYKNKFLKENQSLDS